MYEYDIIRTYKLYTCKLLKRIHLEKRVYVVGKLVSYVALSMRCLNMSNTVVKANFMSITLQYVFKQLSTTSEILNTTVIIILQRLNRMQRLRVLYNKKYRKDES